MHEHEQAANSTEQDDAATEPAGSEVADEQPVDPSINVGRDSFGNVSDFGIHPNAPDTRDPEQ